MEEKEIIKRLQRVECELSPENLHCDGEISRAAARKKQVLLLKIRAELVKMLGREPTDAEIYGA